MIHIPIAIPNPQFRWMASFWCYMMKRVYGPLSYKFSLLSIVKKNHVNDQVINQVDWDLSGLPYVMSDSVYEYVESTNPNCIVINVFSALKEAVNAYGPEEVICVTDMDVIPLQPYTGKLPKENEVICYDGYEDWHMFIANKDKKNYKRIEKYLEHSEQGYMNGGFVPILIRNNTLQKIIDDVIETAEKIIEDPESEQNWKWWSCMTSFSIVCHNHKIKMIGADNTYIPNINECDLSKHYFAHYSVDPKFNKHKFPNMDFSTLPDNAFYNFVKEWMIR